ncbi:anthranilate synthase component I family protein [Bacterioplanoides sp.]|uniref:anthranilate synthase component I family protein n=1 Tax=Bacterioplanoides sp. TaxID=2066072 RepID=UPI003B5957CE
MSHKKLDLSARTALNRAHALDNPILLSAGDYSGRYILAYAPEQLVPSATSCATEWQKQIKPAWLDDTSNCESTEKSSANKPFASGWAGFFHYPSISSLNTKPEHHNQPKGVMAYYNCSLLLDIDTDEVWLQNPKQLSDKTILSWLEPLYSGHSVEAEPHQHKWSALWSQPEYTNAFNKVQDYLRAGDCYQINLTMPFRCSGDLTEKSPYPLIKQFRPAFGGYMKTKGLTLFSVSPERFIRIDGDRIETKPIKGTLPRGATSEQDQQLKQQLADSNKNKAENLMIVDLLRNDLSRSAEPHSVKVEKLFELESHANVHHLVSTISAKKRADKSHLDVILDAFPGGSITGAPKKRAMEVIEELEIKPRGLYCGSLGYFDDAGHSDFNILIRSIVATKEGAECWGGGGITVDSTADDEYQEIMNKVGKILSTPM